MYWTTFPHPTPCTNTLILGEPPAVELADPYSMEVELYEQCPFLIAELGGDFAERRGLGQCSNLLTPLECGQQLLAYVLWTFDETDFGDV